MIRLLIILILISNIAFAQDKVILEADNIDSPAESVYHATGSVKVFQTEKTLTADEAYFYKDTNDVHAIGNVKLTENGNVITCDELKYNTDTESGEFYNVDAFLVPYHWLKATRLDRRNPISFHAVESTYTTCEGEKPDWSFKSKEADVDIGGYLKSKHTTWRVKDVPLLYTPYLIYPVKTERETGFLIPDFGYNIDLGAYITPKFFIDLGVDQDITVAAAVNTEELPILSLEHRYKPNLNSNLYTYIEYTGESSEYPDNVNGEYTLVEESGRYFVYNKSNLQIYEQLSLVTNIDTVSDYEYLDDYGSLTQLENYDNDTDTYKIDLALTYNSKFADVKLRYQDDKEYTVNSSSYSEEHTYISPHVSIYENITTLPIYFQYKFAYDDVKYSKYNYTYNTNTTTDIEKTYERQFATVKAYKPINLYIGTFTPSITYYKTKWYNLSDNITMPSDYTNSSYANLKVEDNAIYRTAYMQNHSFALNEIYKNYSNFKHSIYNTVSYVQTPYIDQTNVPDFIYSDIFDPSRYYNYKLQNMLEGDKWSASLTTNYKYTMLDPELDNDSYTNTLKITLPKINYDLKHTYDLTNHNDEYFGTSINASTGKFSISGSFNYDRDADSDDYNTGVSIGLKYTMNKYELSYTKTLEGDNTTISSGNLDNTVDSYKILYKKNCWNVALTYERDSNPKSVDIDEGDEVEHSVTIVFSLKGLGDDTKFANNLEDDEDEL